MGYTSRQLREFIVFYKEVSPINYKCHLQHTIALSTAESERYATCEAAKYIKYIYFILNHLGFTQNKPSITYEDNTVAIAVQNNEPAT